MHIIQKLSVFTIAAMVATLGHAGVTKFTELKIPANNLKIDVLPDQQTLKINFADKIQTCKIENLQGHKRIISELRLNYEETAVILSNIDYLPIDDLVKCEKGIARAASVPSKTPGMLADINLTHKLYLSIGYVTVNPMSHLATIAKLGSTRNLIRLPGSYAGGTEKTAYSEFDQLDPKAKISLDGRYVSPSDVVSCGGHPGVWDLKTKRAVTFPDASQSERKEQCEALFSK
jgi:hypothetical protein